MGEDDKMLNERPKQEPNESDKEYIFRLSTYISYLEEENYELSRLAIALDKLKKSIEFTLSMFDKGYVGEIRKVQKDE